MKLAILAAMLLAATVPAAQAAKTPLPGVVTPSGNIHCFYVPGPPGHLLCDIHQAAYNKQEQAGCMARAGLDWHGWEVYATRKTVTTCSGGILYNSNTGTPKYTTLAYGKTWQLRVVHLHLARHGPHVQRTWARDLHLPCVVARLVR